MILFLDDGIKANWFTFGGTYYISKRVACLSMNVSDIQLQKMLGYSRLILNRK